jgi:PAS domain S-box-containing protein
MTLTTDPRRTTSTWIRGLLGVAVALIAAYVVWTLPGVRPRPGFDTRFDGFLQGSGYVLVAVLALVGTLRRAATSPAWWCVVVAVALRALGFAIALVGLGLGHVPSYPSYADAAWVASDIALFVALALRLREMAPRLTRLVVLDGVAATLVTVGLAVNVLAGPLRTLTGSAVPYRAIVMNVLYPASDVALLVLVAAIVVLGRRLSAADLVLLGGVLGFVVVDVVYFVLLAEGLWRPGTLLASFSLVTTAVIGAAVVASQAPSAPRSRRPGEESEAELSTGIAAPASIVATIIVVLTLSGLVLPVVPVALALYAVGGAVAITRGVQTIRNLQTEAGRVVDEASFDLALFKALVDASGDMIGMADDRGRMLYLNPSGRRLLGISAESDVSPLLVGKLAPGTTPEELPHRWRAVLEEGTWRGEAQLVPVDGRPAVPVEISTFLIGDAGAGRRLVGTIQRDITNRLRIQQDVRDLAEQRAALLQRLVQAEEDERARIAHDVHDDPVQTLAAVGLRLTLLRRKIEAELPIGVADVEVLQSIVGNATERLRNLLFDLDSLREGTTLADAITEAAAFILGESHVAFRVVEEPGVTLSRAQQVTVHRVVKEALTNVSKHAGASDVVVTLSRSGATAVVTVDDDGCGIEPGEDRDRPGHLGLTGSRDRAQVAGGSLEVGRRPEGGTRLRLTLPL